ncbi:hypothetical protein BLOT_010631 [Blomia tropicalis]|nr:hypothetical protein BLOT_010631 [Blomia tropicalis]
MGQSKEFTHRYNISFVQNVEQNFIVPLLANESNDKMQKWNKQFNCQLAIPLIGQMNCEQ